MVDEELLYWIWLTNIKGIGPSISKILLEKFKKVKYIYESCKDELIELKGVGEATANLIVNSKDLSTANNILDKCKKLNINILTYTDELYPRYVKNYKKSPVVLYYKGKLHYNSIGVAIVGSRRCTDYGKRIAKEAGEFLAKNNIAIISGMAKGIDGYANTACINAEGYTIAVLGCGVDVCYPKEHYKLMEQIIEQGAVISEYPPGTKPNEKNFPRRNAIISAFSKKILVVEAGENSGAIITAQHGKDMNREVLVVPHNIYSVEGKGCNELISSGFKIFNNFNQLINEMSEFQIEYIEDKENNYNNTEEFSDVENKVIKLLNLKPSSLDEIIYLLNMNSNIAINTLFLLELKGVVRLVGQYYRTG